MQQLIFIKFEFQLWFLRPACFWRNGTNIRILYYVTGFSKRCITSWMSSKIFIWLERADIKQGFSNSHLHFMNISYTRKKDKINTSSVYCEGLSVSLCMHFRWMQEVCKIRENQKYAPSAAPWSIQALTEEKPEPSALFFDPVLSQASGISPINRAPQGLAYTLQFINQRMHI